jgi:hypothetical protein
MTRKKGNDKLSMFRLVPPEFNNYSKLKKSKQITKQTNNELTKKQGKKLPNEAK